jgi:Tol biopolymer transport system component
MAYNHLEKKIALLLSSFPSLKASVKDFYQKINYLIYKKQINYSSAFEISCVSVDDNESFFGYYDKSPWSSKGCYLFNSVGKNKYLEICIKDTPHSEPKVISRSRTWNWQQGSMAQWWGEDSKIIYNDIVEEKVLGSKIINMYGDIIRQYEFPVQSISPSNDYFVSLNYARLAKLRPDYGYTNIFSNFYPSMPDDKDGLWVVSSSNGAAQLIVSLYQLKNIKYNETMKGAQHKINHAIISPDGKRILFMHRWFSSSGKSTRLYTISPDGDNIYLLFESSMISHCSWRDNSTIIVWGNTRIHGDAYHMLKDMTSEVDIIGGGVFDIYGDGHPSFSPSGRWLLTDTYPNRSRMQSLLLFDTYEKEIHNLGSFLSPLKFKGEYRCDLHPRWSPDGSQISIDSSHSGNRKNYIINVEGISKKNIA